MKNDLVNYVDGGMWGETRDKGLDVLTFFANERVIPVVRVIRVAKTSMRILEFEELVAVLPRVTRADVLKS